MTKETKISTETMLEEARDQVVALYKGFYNEMASATNVQIVLEILGAAMNLKDLMIEFLVAEGK